MHSQESNFKVQMTIVQILSLMCIVATLIALEYELAQLLISGTFNFGLILLVELVFATLCAISLTLYTLITWLGNTMKAKFGSRIATILYIVALCTTSILVEVLLVSSVSSTLLSLVVEAPSLKLSHMLCLVIAVHTCGLALCAKYVIFEVWKLISDVLLPRVKRALSEDEDVVVVIS